MKNKPTLELRPCSLKDANEYVTRLHRHSAKVVGHKFSLGAWLDGELVGVAIVGRPIARLLDDGATLEVTRCCTAGARNACSFLYGAAWRAARALGYTRMVTYTLEREDGASLRAVGWAPGEPSKTDWTSTKRARQSPLLRWGGIDDPRKHDKGPKVRWEVDTHQQAPEPAQ